MLLDAGASVKVLDTVTSQSPLHLAVQRRNLASVLLLLDAGAKVDHLDHRHCSALCYATLNGSLEIVEALVLRSGTESDING